MKLKINLYGKSLQHNIVNGQISTTPFKEPKHIEFVLDNSAEINLFIDHEILNISNHLYKMNNFGWLLESPSVHPELISYFKTDTENKLKYFKKIFTHNIELIKLNKKFEFLAPTGYWVDENINTSKSKLVSMITSNKRHTPLALKRYEFAKYYYNKIDIFGKGFHPIYKKETGLAPYYFSVVIENDATPDYFSEKILDCFATKTIPIYLGCKNIGKYFDIDGIILFENFDFKSLTTSNYNERIKSIENNFKLVKSYKLPEDNLYYKII